MITFRDLDLDPTVTRLRQFALFGAALLILAAAVLSRDSLPMAGGFLAVAAILALIGLVRPAAARPLYVAMTLATFPIGWTLSRLMVVVFYYLVLTPIALVLRLFRKTPHEHGHRRDAESYWIESPPAKEPARYFDQF